MADSPKEGEAAQALFCAIADSLGAAKTNKEFDLAKYPSYEIFRKTYQKLIKECFNDLDTPQITLNQIENFLVNSDGWYESSINIAKKLLDEIDTISKKFTRIKYITHLYNSWVRSRAFAIKPRLHISCFIYKSFSFSNKSIMKYFDSISKIIT